MSGAGGDDSRSGSGSDLASLRRAFAAGPSRPPAPAECPAPETIWLAVHGELPADALREVVDHLAACPACAEEWRLAVAFERPQVEEDETAAAPEPERRRRGRHPLAAWLAASGVAASLHVGGTPAVLRAPAVLRGGPPPAAAPVPPLLVETGGQALSRTSCFLHWTGSHGALYEIVVRTRSGRTVARAEGLAVNFYRVPDAALADLPPGAVLTWQVTATGPGGRSAASQAGMFFLR